MRSPRMRARAGLTLIELMVVLALLALLYSIVGASIPAGAGEPDTLSRSLLEARRIPILDAHTVSRSWRDGRRTLKVTAFPSGLVLADTGRGTFIVALERFDETP